MFSEKLPFHEWRRDYSLNELPRDESGNVLYRGDSQEDYLAYVAWLANYLYETPLPPTERQALIDETLISKTNESAIQFLAMDAAIYDAQMMSVENFFDNEQEALDLEFYTSKQIEIGRIDDASRRKNNVTPEDEEDFCDLPWRVPLAAIIKKVSDKQERIKLVRLFYTFYQEYSRK
ncbi:MAG: hypothetical protein ACR2N3_13245 [Pyrinomonadaceae bacterium]